MSLEVRRVAPLEVGAQRKHKTDSGVMTVFGFLIRALVIYVYSVCETSLSCTSDLCTFLYVCNTQQVFKNKI